MFAPRRKLISKLQTISSRCFKNLFLFWNVYKPILFTGVAGPPGGVRGSFWNGEGALGGVCRKTPITQEIWGVLLIAEMFKCRACKRFMSEGTIHRVAYLRHLTREGDLRGEDSDRSSSSSVFSIQCPCLFILIFSFILFIYMFTAGFFIWEEARR